jgi:hypothetical protein
VSAFIGLDSFLGAVHLAWGHAFGDEEADAFYFLLGTP